MRMGKSSKKPEASGTKLPVAGGRVDKKSSLVAKKREPLFSPEKKSPPPTKDAPKVHAFLVHVKCGTVPDVHRSARV